MHNTNKSETAMLGTTVSHYRILEKLGEGGMGVVYKAEDTKLKRNVALKFLPQELTADPDARTRFMREAQTASSLDHPNIGVIHEIDETADGRSFICMALYEGETLKERIQRGPLPVEEAVRIAWQVADGLRRAHSAGIIHRDIKPANLILTADGKVKIVDFGLAKLVQAARAATSGTRSGTAAYMSPEQIQNSAVDARSDLFSLGVVLYEMVTGSRPFAGEHEAALFYSIIYNEPVRPRKLRPEIPERLDKLIMSLLQKDPAKRPADAAGVVSALDDLKEPTAVRAPAAGENKLIRFFSRSNAATAAGIVVLAVLLMLAPLAWRTVATWMNARNIPAQKHIVVLPFTCVGCDQKERAISDGLVETLTSKLTQFSSSSASLWVVASSEVRGDGVETPSEARRVFGATLVIAGSVQHMDGGLRLTLNLVDPKTSRQLRSHVFDASAADLSGLQDQFVDVMATFLDLRLDKGAAGLAKAGETTKSSAYELYLQARGYMLRYEEPENLETAAGLFRKAFMEDPGYALAYAGLGEVYWRMFENNKDPRWADSAIAFSSRAVQIDSTLVPVRITMGIIYGGTGRDEEAVAQFRQAIELDPSNGNAYSEMGAAYDNLGDTTRAEAAYMKAIGISPSYWGYHNYLGKYYLRHGRTRDAMLQFRKVVDLTPDNYRGYFNLGAGYFYLGELDSARSALEESVKLKPNYAAYSNLGTLLYYRGEFAASAKSYESALEIDDKDYTVWANLAAAYSQTGEKGKSINAYRVAIQKADAVLRLNPDNAELMSNVAGYHISVGERKKARQLISRALRIAPGNVFLVGRAAMTFEELGDRDEALRLLQKAFRKGYPPTEVENAPEMKELRNDPRYKELLRKAGH